MSLVEAAGMHMTPERTVRFMSFFSKQSQLIDVLGPTVVDEAVPSLVYIIIIISRISDLKSSTYKPE